MDHARSPARPDGGTCPELIDCCVSPEMPTRDLPTSVPATECSVVISFENGLPSAGVEDVEREIVSDSSFELQPKLKERGESEKNGIYVNSGCSNGKASCNGLIFMEDCGFFGGETVSVRDSLNNHGDDILSLYRTARVGDFSYKFQVDHGEYTVRLHLAETESVKVGDRVFDVYIQNKKVVSGLDIFARVGGNMPLVISDLRATVCGEEGLSIKFVGLSGLPILCGLSIVKDSFTEYWEDWPSKQIGIVEQDSNERKKKRVRWEDESEYEIQDYERTKQELAVMRRAFEELKKNNVLKSKECQEAWNSMRELQNELMRKSMHVGSLAFAIEGQVKEKSKWFTSLSDITRKLKVMKMEHFKLAEEALEYKEFLKEINCMASVVEATIKLHVNVNDDLKMKYLKGAKERKELYNKVLELKGNIRVFCRCRPLNAEEIAHGAVMAINLESAKDRELMVTTNGIPKKCFKFDAVFGPQATQADVYEEASPFATSVLDGYNACIFAYGQTGTGKTFTMEGTETSRGVNYRTLEELFNIIKERQNQFRYEVSVSVLEIYNEQIRDLLIPSYQGSERRLEVRQMNEGTHHVPGLVEAQVQNVVEAWEVLRNGSKARAVGATSANDYSSRSHCMYCVTVKGENLLNGECTRSKLWLVDLAGSERIAKTEVQGDRLKETQNINKSLSALGDVIAALASKSPHIPFRNSKLTHLLQDSLGGDSKTLMFVQVNPNESDIGETMCSLNFASRARGIELGAPKKQLDTFEILKYKKLAERSKQDLNMKDIQMKKMEESIHYLDMKIKEKDLKNKNLQDKIKELEWQLLVERKLARQHVDTKIAEQHMKQQSGEHSAPPKSQHSYKLFPANCQKPSVKDAANPNHLLAENLGGDTFSADPPEKENNPPEFLPHQRTRRASLYAGPQAMLPLDSSPRRKSLVPISGIPGVIQATNPGNLQVDLPSGKREMEIREDIMECRSPNDIRNAAKKLGGILRRSLQKRVHKSPVQHQLRRGGINVGAERLRVSIGSRGRLLGGGRRALNKETQNRNKKEKERGWNF